jgi:hypothetical protein
MKRDSLGSDADVNGQISNECHIVFADRGRITACGTHNRKIPISELPTNREQPTHG